MSGVKIAAGNRNYYHDMGLMTWEEFGSSVEKENAVVILPVRATESHRPHLPLGTDSPVARKIAELVTERSDRKGEGDGGRIISVIVVPMLG